MSEDARACLFEPDVIHARRRRALLSIGAARRLLDHAAGVLTSLKTPLPRDGSPSPEDLRTPGQASFTSVPPLNALLLHLGRWMADHGEPVCLVDGVPDAWSARVAHAWLEGRLGSPWTPDEPGLAALCDWAGSDAFPEARLAELLGRTRQPSALSAWETVDEISRGTRTPVACFVRWIDQDFVLPPPDGIGETVLPVVHTPSETPLAPLLQEKGWTVHTAPVGLGFEAGLYAALERAWHRVAGGPALVLMQVPGALGQPSTLQAGGPPQPDEVARWLRSYHVEKLLKADGGLPEAVHALVSGPRMLLD